MKERVYERKGRTSLEEQSELIMPSKLKAKLITEVKPFIKKQKFK